MPEDHASPKTTRRQTTAVLGLALVLRLLIAAISLGGNGAHWFFHRGLEMGWLAQSLLEGHGLSSPFGVPTGPTAFIAPLYPMLVAAVFAVAGSFTALSAAVLIGLNLAANVLTIWLMMRLAGRLFGRGAALAAGLIWACSLPLLWMPTIFWETSLSTLALTAAVTFTVEAPHLKPRAWAGLGVVCALVGLMNPALLPTLLALLVCAAWRAEAHRPGAAQWRAPLLRLALAVVAFAVVFSPWPVRNARVFHAFIPLRTTVGFELWMGNRPGADGYLDEKLFPAFNAGELAEYERVGELAYTNGKQAVAERYIEQHPGRFMQLTAIRTWRYWSGSGSKDASWIFALHALMTTLAGLYGLYEVNRRMGWRVALCFAIPLLLFPLPYTITHAEFRYRLVIDPLLTVLAAGALMRLVTRGQSQETTVERAVAA